MSPTDKTLSSTLDDHWWQRPFSVFQTNLQDIDATMDVEAALDAIEAHSADTWLINVGGIFSFYPSELPFQTPVAFLKDRASGDLIADAVAAARRRGIRVLARCDYSKVSSTIAAANPDWLFVSADGEPQVFNSLYSTCPSGAYYQERSLDVVDEILGRYDVAGFFFNWFKFPEVDYARVYHGVCHCRACEDGFSKYSGGAELPADPSHANYGLWRRFCGQVIENLNLKIWDRIRNRRAGVGLVLKRGAPIFYYEANNAFGRDFWPHATSEAVSAHVTGWPNTALMVNCVTFVDMPYRMAGEQPEHFAQYQLQAMARGGNLSTYIMGAPGRIQYPAMDVGGEIMRFYRRHYPEYAALRSASTIGLIRPDPIELSAAQYNDAVEEFRGCYSVLKDAGLPFDILDFTALAAKDLGGLGQYRLLIAPNIGAFGHTLAGLLDQYVSSGGNVLLTGASGVTTGGEIEMQSAPGIMRNGPSVSGKDLWSSYIAPSVNSTPADFTYSDSFLPIYGAYARYVWKPRAEKSGVFIPQAPYGPPEKCYGHEATAFPGKVVLKTGGSVVHVPWSVGATYREFGTSELSQYLIECIVPLDDPILRAKLPGSAEVIIGRAGRQLIVHIINQTGERRRSFGPHMTLSGGELIVSTSAVNAQALVSGHPLELTQVESGDVCIKLPDVGLFEVVAIDLQDHTPKLAGV